VIGERRLQLNYCSNVIVLVDVAAAKAGAYISTIKTINIKNSNSIAITVHRSPMNIEMHNRLISIWHHH
jgi:hypothetical protein